MTDATGKWIMFNGEFREAGDQLLAPGSRAVRYGDGCFETLRWYGRGFLLFEEHITRLQEGLRYLNIASPFSMNPNRLKESIEGLLSRNRLHERQAVVRIQVWREGPRGYRVPGGGGSGYAISAAPLPALPDAVSLKTVSTRRIPAAALDPRFKLSNGLNYIRAAGEAAAAGADDAVMLTVDGYVSETTIANLFWINSRGAVETPSEECDLLPGITRSITIRILEEELGVSVNRDKFLPEQLKSARTAWICNSLRELMPVDSLDGSEFEKDNTLFQQLESAFETFRDNQIL